MQENTVMREYGSEHHWQSRAWFESGFGGLELEGWRFYRSGRDALKELAELKRGSKLLLPGICCESMVLPFIQNGCEVDFYKLDRKLRGDGDDVLKKASSGSVLLYMPYFDVQPFDSAFLQNLRDRGVFLIEDRTQDIIVPRQGGFEADATVASLRKWAAMPEGGALKTDIQLPKRQAEPRFAALRKSAMQEKGEYLLSGRPEQKLSFLQKLRDADELLDQKPQAVAMGADNLKYIERLDFAAILRARRENCAVLEERLKGQKLKALCSSRITAGLYYPVLVEDRDEIQRKMAAESIYCPVIWPIPQEAQGKCKNCAYIAEHILALPCDQRYSRDDMEHIAQTLITILNQGD